MQMAYYQFKPHILSHVQLNNHKFQAFYQVGEQEKVFNRFSRPWKKNCKIREIFQEFLE